MAKYCIFRLTRDSVDFLESFTNYSDCDKRCDYLTDIAIMYNTHIRYIKRKLEDDEDPNTYNPFCNVIYIKH